MPIQLHDDDLLRRFSGEVAAAADAMLSGPPRIEGGLPEVSLAPLRRLHEQAERYLRIAKSPRAEFSLFLLSAFLEDFFYNLSGDVPYGAESERCRQQYFASLPDAMRNFSSAIVDENAAKSFDACERMVSSYLETVTRISDLLDQE